MNRQPATTRAVRAAPGGGRALRAGLAGALLAAIWGCSDPVYDTSTPDAAVASMRQMIADGRADLLATMVHVDTRDVTFDDGVTESSAVEDVREKTGDMLAQLWRVSTSLRDRFPDEVDHELEVAADRAAEFGIGQYIRGALVDPFRFLDEQQSRLSVEDLMDGTALVLIDDEPLMGGELAMIETGEGWRFYVPLDLVQDAPFWPQTRHEWAVVASMMLGVENALGDFEAELEQGEFRSLRDASERAGRLVGESVIAQSIIYATMKRVDEDGG